VEDRRIELLLHACKAHVLPLSLIPHKLVSVERFELPLHAPKARVLPGYTTPRKIGSRGRDRTYDQLINSQLHYRCATLEQNWRSQGVTIPFFMRDRHTCVHEHFETKIGEGGRDRTYCGLSRKIYSLLPYHYGGTSKFFGRPTENRTLIFRLKAGYFSR
jgi:hypothetical protein